MYVLHCRLSNQYIEDHRTTKTAVAALLLATASPTQAQSIASEFSRVYGMAVDTRLAKEGVPDSRRRLRERLRDYTLEDHHEELVREQRATRLEIQRLEQQLRTLR